MPEHPKARRKFSDHIIDATRISPKLRPSSPVSTVNLLSISIESPPLVNFGPASSSTGALLSGLLRLTLPQSEHVQELKLQLIREFNTRRPVHANCTNCSNLKYTLKEWSFAKDVSLDARVHGYPFSHLLKGNLPAETKTALGSVHYYLIATLTYGAKTKEQKLRKDIPLARALLSTEDRHSGRVFPPTNIAAHVTLPDHSHPGSEFSIELSISGIIDETKQLRWVLKKVSWRVDEIAKIFSVACPVHNSKLLTDGGLPHKEVRTVGAGVLKHGWKTDWTQGGKIEMEFRAGTHTFANAAYDTDMPDAEGGLHASHVLIIEAAIVEEKKAMAASWVISGSARILRMNFAMPLSARPGLGISWDEEIPPMYDDVPARPPKFEADDDSEPPPFTQVIIANSTNQQSGPSNETTSPPSY